MLEKAKTLDLLVELHWIEPSTPGFPKTRTESERGEAWQSLSIRGSLGCPSQRRGSRSTNAIKSIPSNGAAAFGNRFPSWTVHFPTLRYFDRLI